MTGKAGSRNRSSTTGKAGYDSGSRRREARGDPGAAGRGKHPPNRLFTSPQTGKKQAARVHSAYSSRQSEQGKRPR